MQELPGAVFLSYASEDAAMAARLCDALRASDIAVWFDQRELRGGDAWDQTIRTRIRDCRLFVPLISRNSESRFEGYFRREWKLAADRMDDMGSRLSYLLPVAVDDVSTATADVPERFRQVQWLRMSREAPTQAFVDRVLGLLRPAAPALPAPNMTPRLVSRPRWRSRAAFGLVGILLLCAGIWWSRRAHNPSGDDMTRTLAVLPFTDLSEHRDQQFFADGIAEEILNLLTRVPNLQVIGHTTAFAYKDRQSDLAAMARELSVKYVLEGSVRRAENRARVTVQLLSVPDGARRWSDSFDVVTSDAIEVEDAIANRVANALDVHLSRKLPPRGVVKSSEAYDAYLRGIQQLEDNSEESVEAARASFQRALALEPGFGAAAVGLADADQYSCSDGYDPAACERALRSVRLATALDPNNPDAYAASAQMHVLYDMNWASAAADIAKANELGGGINTQYAAARLAYATGQWAQARDILRGLIATDPFDPYAYFDLALYVEQKVGNLAEAEKLLRHGLQISPHYGLGHVYLAWMLLLEGRIEEAIPVVNEERPEDGRALGLALITLAQGHRDEGIRMLEALHAPPYARGDLACAYAFAGESDRALTLLEQAWELREPGLWFINESPALKSVASTDRFNALLRKMKLPSH